MPSLPQHDPRPARRQQRLARARARYQFCSDPELGLPALESLPPEERFGVLVGATAGRLAIELGVNQLARRASDVEQRVRAWIGEGGLLARVAPGLRPPATDPRPACPETREHAAAALRSTLAPSALHARLPRRPALEDRLFAWQRLAGVNPLNLRRIERPPDRFPVSAALVRRVLADGDTLAAAAAEGRLLLGDWSVLEDMPNGSYAGQRKHVHAPLALFVARRPSGAAPAPALSPVAIQCAQRPGPGAPVLCPLDGVRWRMAKTVVQVADLNVHELQLHLGRCHFLVELFAVAARRRLSEAHPLLVLLAPHLRHTLAINDLAKRELLRPGGEVDTLLAGTRAGSLALIRRTVEGFELGPALFDEDLRRRGLDDRDALPVYPWRDDGAPLWDAIQRWVSDYVDRYYPGELYRAQDDELRAWLKELVDPEGAGLRGLGAVDDLAALKRLLSFLLFTCSALHSAINYSQYALAGYMPSMPCAAFAPAPTLETPDAPNSWDAMLMPPELAARQLEFFYQQSEFRLNLLGEYPRAGFEDDERIAAALQRFRRRLDALDFESRARDQYRPLSYPWLQPSRIPASVHI